MRDGASAVGLMYMVGQRLRHEPTSRTIYIHIYICGVRVRDGASAVGLMYGWVRGYVTNHDDRYNYRSLLRSL